jgi:hypothetical protein
LWTAEDVRVCFFWRLIKAGHVPLSEEGRVRILREASRAGGEALDFNGVLGTVIETFDAFRACPEALMQVAIDAESARLMSAVLEHDGNFDGCDVSHLFAPGVAFCLCFLFDARFFEALAAVQPDFGQWQDAILAVLKGQPGVPRAGDSLSRLQSFVFLLAHAAQPHAGDLADAFVSARQLGAPYLVELLKYVPFPQGGAVARTVVQVVVDESDAASVDALLCAGVTL